MNRIVARTALIGALITLILQTVPANAAITTATASQLAAAMESGVGLVSGASMFSETLAGTPNAVADAASGLASFPTDGNTYAIMTSGNAHLADDPNSTGSAGANNGGGNLPNRGDTHDVSVLEVDVTVPIGHNCLMIDFRFLSEEYPEFVGGTVNDAFVAELDQTTWTANAQSQIIADDNFAFGPDGEAISINTQGPEGMTVAEAAGTTYDGATPLLRASTQISPGPHEVFFSIFDTGDGVYDSAVFLDNLRTSTQLPQNCAEGAELAAPSITKEADESASVAGGSNGYTITIENPNDEDVDVDSISDDLPAGFSYTAGSTTGATTDDPTQTGSTLEWTGPFTVPAGGSIQLHFDVTVAQDGGVYTNEASADSLEVAIPPTGPVADILVLEPPTIGKTVDEANPTIGDQVEYTIHLSNPNDGALTLETISDALPAGFVYVPGSTGGVTSADPAIAGQTLTWDVDDDLGPGADTLSFRATAALTSGAFSNQASADFTETGTIGTGPTALVTTTGGCSPTPTLVGTQVGDTLLGGDGADHILGLAGRDRINTLGGPDVACAGAGSDQVYGRRGSDDLFGDAGHDRLKGGNGGDDIVGGPGHDAIIAGAGNDVIDAQDGTRDCIMTGQGTDVVNADAQDRIDPARRCPAGFWL